MMVDYLSDLAAYSVADIDAACAAYRRDGENKFYPRPGELLTILNPKREPSERPRLKTFTASEYAAPRSNIKSVAEILRKNGFERAADGWESHPK